MSVSLSRPDEKPYRKCIDVLNTPCNYWIDHKGKVLRREYGFSTFQAWKME